MNSNQLPLSGGIAVFFAVIIGYFVIDPSALDGFRPGGDSSQIDQVHGIEDVQARLWQDPFAAAAMHKSSHKLQSASIQFAGKSFEVIAGTSQPKKKEGLNRHTLKTLRSEICEEASEQAERKNKTCQEEDGISILAVMVPAGPYAKPAETRKRMRYAVLSGLGTAQYYPKDAEHIGYVDDLNTSEEIKNIKNGKQRLNLVGGGEQLPHVMPYEWYEKSSKTGEKHVLLLWLDEDAFGKKPLTKLDVLFASLGKHISSIKMIGPYSSTLLKAMVKEAQNKPQFGILKGKVDVYSATATIVNGELVKKGNIQSILSGDGVFKTFQRSIVTDGKLADKLVNEIQLRMKPKEAKNMNYQVAIVSEWDTLYGRALPRAYLNAAGNCMINKTCNKGEQREFKVGNLYRFTYMRGIDGALAARERASQSKDKTKNDEAGNANTQTVVVERPEGRSQKDYLRRLADEISRTDRKLKASGDRGIRAIGVLGSDVYDKLLILRVLRERFPKAVFFTTDLDAALLHPDQFPWTRNMVVASAYGLDLLGNDKLGIPPFRDSYQTSVFRSTRLAIGKKVNDQSALVYEIARNGAVSMNARDHTDWLLVSRLTTAFLLFVWLAILFWRRWLNRDAYQSVFNKKQSFIRRFFNWIGKLIWWIWVANFIISVAMAVGVNFFATDPDLYLVAFVLAVQWIVWLYLYFCLKSWRMQKPLSYVKEVHLAVWLLAGFLILVLGVGRDEPFSLLSGISIWPTEFIRLAAIWLTFFLLWRGWSKMQKGGLAIGKTLGITAFSDAYNIMSSCDIRKIWNEYQLGGSWSFRLKRICLPAVIWVLICLLIFKLQSPNIPFRGAGAYWADVGIGVCAIGAFFILFCFVVDAALHCRVIIQKLIDYDTVWPFMKQRVKNGGKENVLDDARELIFGIKREWKETHLIAMRTDDISKTVYYPVYVILLLLAAQSDYFDNWDMPYPLMLIATVNVAIVLWATIMLRRKAVEARSVSLDKIRHIESQALGISDSAIRKCVMRKIRFYKAEIENIREGAFLPISEQPWLRALTLMGGGGGSLLLLQAMAG